MAAALLQERTSPLQLKLIENRLITTTEGFYVAQRFRLSESHEEVSIVSVDPQFSERTEGLWVQECADCPVRIWETPEFTSDLAVRRHFVSRVETGYAETWEVLKLQGKGGPGSLVVGNVANIAYLPDTKGTLMAVSFIWLLADNGWEIKVSEPKFNRYALNHFITG